MLLDRLLAHASLEVAPFAVCDIRRASRLRFEGARQARVHFVLGGHGQLGAKGRSYELRPYTLALVPPGMSHFAEAADDTSEVSLSNAETLGVEHVVSGTGETALALACGALRVEVGASGLFERLVHPVVEAFEASERMRQLFDALLDEQREARPGQLRVIESIMMECIVHLLRRLTGARPSELGWLAALEDAQLRRALDAILARPGDAHTLDSLANVAAMSRSTFGARFKETMGQSPMAFLKEVRLQAGAKLLRTTDLPIKAIAAKVGYSSRSHFSREFRKQFSRDPIQFRTGADEEDGDRGAPPEG